MSNGDFEVHSRGTTEELRMLRAFVREITDLEHQLDTIVPKPLCECIQKINYWYSSHVAKYPEV